MKAIPGGHNLFVADVEVAKRIENLYNKFKVSEYIYLTAAANLPMNRKLIFSIKVGAKHRLFGS